MFNSSAATSMLLGLQSPIGHFPTSPLSTFSSAGIRPAAMTQLMSQRQQLVSTMLQSRIGPSASSPLDLVLGTEHAVPCGADGNQQGSPENLDSYMKRSAAVDVINTIRGQVKPESVGLSRFQTVIHKTSEYKRVGADRNTVRKEKVGKWNDAHAKIAWTIYNRQRQKTLQDKTKPTEELVSQADISNSASSLKEEPISLGLKSAFGSFQKCKTSSSNGAAEEEDDCLTTNEGSEVKLMGNVNQTTGNASDMSSNDQITEGDNSTHKQWRKVIPGVKSKAPVSRRCHSTKDRERKCKGSINQTLSPSNTHTMKSPSSTPKRHHQSLSPDGPNYKYSKTPNYSHLQPINYPTVQSSLDAAMGVNLTAIHERTGYGQPQTPENMFLKTLTENIRASEITKYEMGYPPAWNGLPVDMSESIFDNAIAGSDPSMMAILNMMAEKERRELQRRFTLQRDNNILAPFGFSAGSLGGGAFFNGNHYR